MRISDSTKSLQPELLRFTFFIAPAAPAISELTQFLLTVSHSHILPYFRLYSGQLRPAGPSRLTFSCRARVASLNLPTQSHRSSSRSLLTIALRHKVVAYTHQSRRVSTILTHAWHRVKRTEHKEGTCLDVCHARVSRIETCSDLPQNHAVFVVEMGGIEPPSDGRPRGLLRAHPAIDFLACDVMQACCQRSSVDEMSERTHRHGPHPVAP